ncbi:MAG: AMP-binding protein [Burkholderiales bacterium]|nr:AMP-binding protein [Burkholderiales bacterium]
MPQSTIEVPDTYRPLTITTGVHAAARRTPHKVALIDGTRMLSFAQLVERMARLGAAGMAELGLAHRDHVAVVAPNCLEFLEVVLGLSDIGVAIVTLSPRLNATELGEIVADSSATVLFAHESCRAVVESARLPRVRRVVWFGDEYEALLCAHAPEAVVRTGGEWDIFSIPYTSGTTGRPKGVLLPHRARALIFHEFAVEFGCFGPDDRFLAFAPFAHGAGLCFGLLPIFFGGCCEILGRFDAATVVEKIATGSHTGVFLVPTQFHAIFSLERDFLAAHRSHALKAMISNASALPQAVKEKIVAQWGDGILHELYGCTEAGVSTNLRPADQLRKQQCVGLPMPCTQVRLLDDAGCEVPQGELGEIYTISPFMFSGYWQEGRRVAPPMLDGWFSAGDIGRLDEEGYLYIVDRKKDMVVSGGINIYPRQIEEVLYGHAAVQEAAVVGVPDPKWGERLKAFVVLRAGAQATTAGLIDFCMERLSSYKVPREVAFVSDLPRNANGKIMKRALREMF